MTLVAIGEFWKQGQKYDLGLNRITLALGWELHINELEQIKESTVRGYCNNSS